MACELCGPVNDTPSTSSRYCTCARVRTAISRAFPDILSSTEDVQHDRDSGWPCLTLASKFLNDISIRKGCHPVKLTEISWEILAPSAVTLSSTNSSKAVLRTRGASTFTYRHCSPDTGMKEKKTYLQERYSQRHRNKRRRDRKKYRKSHCVKG
jgi:hypothetical protein